MAYREASPHPRPPPNRQFSSSSNTSRSTSGSSHSHSAPSAGASSVATHILTPGAIDFSANHDTGFEYPSYPAKCSRSPSHQSQYQQDYHGQQDQRGLYPSVSIEEPTPRKAVDTYMAPPPRINYSPEMHSTTGSGRSSPKNTSGQSPRWNASGGGSGYRNGGSLGLGSSPVSHPPALPSPGLDSPRSFMSPHAGRTGSFSGVRAGASPRSVISGLRGVEAEGDVERMAYTYSLRVAALHEHLARATSTPNLPATPTLPGGPGPLPRRKSFNFLKPKSPSRSSSSASPGNEKDKEYDGPKFPKEFLMEFWLKLAEEPGDQGWVVAKQGFLGLIKKGTKTEGGGNLREVGTLLEAFSSCIPLNAPSHVHHTHILTLLQTFLPRSNYFSPHARPQSEKDKDLRNRLLKEISSFSLNNGPQSPASPYDPSSPVSTRSRSFGGEVGRPAGLGYPVTPGGPEVEEKVVVGEMCDTVGLIFGIGREGVEREITEMRTYGRLEDYLIQQLYAKDLKSSIAHLTSLPTLSSTQRHRLQHLQNTLSKLYDQYPHLSMPTSFTSPQTSPYPDSPGFASRGSFFTPSRKMEVYSYLCERGEENLTLSTRAQGVIMRCVDIWGVPNQTEREKEVEGLIIAWTRVVGRGPEELQIGEQLVEGVDDLCAGISPGEPLPRCVNDLVSALVSVLGKAVGHIFPGPTVRAPPPSLLPLLLAGEGVLLGQEKVKRRLNELSDDLKGAAVGEYVGAVGHLMGGLGGTGGSSSRGGSPVDGVDGGTSQIKGYEEVAKWIEDLVQQVRKAWGEGLGERLNPAGIILSKQLPLFFAELQMLDPPSSGGSDAVFGLYEITGKLAATFKEVCPETEHGFEIDAFFEPYILAWLKETEGSKVHEWVSRAVGMDNWTPEGRDLHSQSVTDLFEFIRQSTQVLSRDLPLGQYKRALYLTDLSKTISLALTQYASTTQALFQADMQPPKVTTQAGELGNKINEKIGGKAGSWLAKGQQAMKGLERKRVEGFLIPATMHNMSAASYSVDSLLHSMQADETARIVAARTKSQIDKNPRHVFTVTLSRGENLLAKGQNKAADAFCLVTDKEGGERVIKTRTVLGAEDPKWEQTFEISVGMVKTLDLAIYDRSLMGKHDLIGNSSFRLDPRSFSSVSTRDVLIPLQPRGSVHVRISMEGGSEKHDIRSHLAGATRALDRAGGDMMREIVDKMMEYVKDQLSVRSLNDMVKPKDKKKGKVIIGEADLEASLAGTLEYFNANFSTFSTCLTSDSRQRLMLHLWQRLIDHLISLLVPPLSDRPSNSTPLTPQEVDITFKWLNMFKSFFNASESGVEHGIPLNLLQSGAYKDIIMLGQYLDLPTPALKDRAGAAVKAVVSKSSTGSGVGGVVLGMNRLALGGAGDGIYEGERTAEILLRIARTR